MKALLALTIAACAVMPARDGRAQPSTPTQTLPAAWNDIAERTGGYSTPTKVDEQRLTLEQRKVALEELKAATEKRRADLEERRFEDERQHRSLVFWGTAAPLFAIFASLVVAGLTIVSQLRTAAATRTHELEKHTEQVKADFHIKAAELILNSRSPMVALRRAELLESVYSEWIPKGMFTGVEATGKLPGNLYEQRVELLRAMAGDLAHAGDITQIWSKLFPDEVRYLPGLEEIRNLPQASTTSTSGVQVAGASLGARTAAETVGR
jgi:hypothetical protein